MNQKIRTVPGSGAPQLKNALFNILLVNNKKTTLKINPEVKIFVAIGPKYIYRIIAKTKRTRVLSEEKC